VGYAVRQVLLGKEAYYRGCRIAGRDEACRLFGAARVEEEEHNIKKEIEKVARANGTEVDFEKGGRQVWQRHKVPRTRTSLDRQLVVFSMNVARLGVPGRLAWILHCATEEGANAVMLQGTSMTTQGAEADDEWAEFNMTVRGESWTVVHSVAAKGDPAGGLTFALQRKWLVGTRLQVRVVHPGRLAVARLINRGANNLDVSLINVYVPPRSATVDARTLQQRYGELEDTIAAVPRRSKIVIAGDFNSKVGSVGGPGLGRHFPQREDAGGRMLRELLLQWNLVAVNTYSEFSKGSFTYSGPHGKPSRIDYIIVEDDDIEEVRVQVLRKLAGRIQLVPGVDHLPLKMVMNCVARREEEPLPLRLNSILLRWMMTPWGAGLKKQFEDTLRERVAEDDGWVKLEQEACRTAEELLVPMKTPKSLWMTEEAWAKMEFRAAMADHLIHVRAQRCDQAAPVQWCWRVWRGFCRFQVAAREARRGCRQAKKQHLADTVAKMDAAWDRGDTKAGWEFVRQLTAGAVGRGRRKGRRRRDEVPLSELTEYLCGPEGYMRMATVGQHSDPHLRPQQERQRQSHTQQRQQQHSQQNHQQHQHQDQHQHQHHHQQHHQHHQNQTQQQHLQQQQPHQQHQHHIQQQRQTPHTPRHTQPPPVTGEITEPEMMWILHQMKWGKVVPRGSANSEVLWLLAHTGFRDRMLRELRDWWSTAAPPLEMNTASVVQISKRNGKQGAKSVRLIHLQPAMAKLFAGVARQKIEAREQVVDEEVPQFGFRAHRSTTDLNVMKWRVQWETKRGGRGLLRVAFDVREAFPTLGHGALWRLVEEEEHPEAARAKYCLTQLSTTAVAQLRDSAGEMVSMLHRKGIRQGDAAGPLMFRLGFQGALQETLSKMREEGVGDLHWRYEPGDEGPDGEEEQERETLRTRLGRVQVPAALMAFADDTEAFYTAEQGAALAEQVPIIRHAFASTLAGYEMDVNEDKTEILGRPRGKGAVQAALKMVEEGGDLRWQQQVKTLGVRQQVTTVQSAELRGRIGLAWGRWRQLKKVWKTHSYIVQRTMFRAVVVSTLLWSAEMVALSDRDVLRLQAAVHKLGRAAMGIRGFRVVNGVRQGVPGRQVRQHFGLVTVFWELRKRRLRWLIRNCQHKNIQVLMALVGRLHFTGARSSKSSFRDGWPVPSADPLLHRLAGDLDWLLGREPDGRGPFSGDWMEIVAKFDRSALSNMVARADREAEAQPPQTQTTTAGTAAETMEEQEVSTPFVCDMCDRTFATDQGKRIHMSRAHGWRGAGAGDVSAWVEGKKCLRCGAVFASNNTCLTHVRRGVCLREGRRVTNVQHVLNNPAVFANWGANADRDRHAHSQQDRGEGGEHGHQEAEPTQRRQQQQQRTQQQAQPQQQHQQSQLQQHTSWDDTEPQRHTTQLTQLTRPQPNTGIIADSGRTHEQSPTPAADSASRQHTGTPMPNTNAGTAAPTEPTTPATTATATAGTIPTVQQPRDQFTTHDSGTTGEDADEQPDHGRARSRNGGRTLRRRRPSGHTDRTRNRNGSRSRSGSGSRSRSRSWSRNWGKRSGNRSEHGRRGRRRSRRRSTDREQGRSWSWSGRQSGSRRYSQSRSRSEREEEEERSGEGAGRPAPQPGAGAGAGVGAGDNQARDDTTVSSHEGQCPRSQDEHGGGPAGGGGDDKPAARRVPQEDILGARRSPADGPANARQAALPRGPEAVGGVHLRATLPCTGGGELRHHPGGGEPGDHGHVPGTLSSAGKRGGGGGGSQDIPNGGGQGGGVHGGATRQKATGGGGSAVGGGQRQNRSAGAARGDGGQRVPGGVRDSTAGQAADRPRADARTGTPAASPSQVGWQRQGTGAGERIPQPKRRPCNGGGQQQQQEHQHRQARDDDLQARIRFDKV
jgi:uncharacterized C2H2 Zn-finger protein